jgi:hypothetical protein
VFPPRERDFLTYFFNVIKLDSAKVILWNDEKDRYGDPMLGKDSGG